MWFTGFTLVRARAAAHGLRRMYPGHALGAEVLRRRDPGLHPVCGACDVLQQLAVARGHAPGGQQMEAFAPSKVSWDTFLSLFNPTDPENFEVGLFLTITALFFLS